MVVTRASNVRDNRRKGRKSGQDPGPRALDHPVGIGARAARASPETCSRAWRGSRTTCGLCSAPRIREPAWCDPVLQVRALAVLQYRESLDATGHPVRASVLRGPGMHQRTAPEAPGRSSAASIAGEPEPPSSPEVAPG